MSEEITKEEAPCGICECCRWNATQEQHEIEYHASTAKMWCETATEMEDVADLLVDVLLKINNGEAPDGLEEALERYRRAKEEG